MFLFALCGFCWVSWLVSSLDLSSALQFYLHSVLIVPLGSRVNTGTCTPSQYNMRFLVFWLMHKYPCQWWRPCCSLSGWRGLSRDEHWGHQEGSGGLSTRILYLCFHRCPSQRLSLEKRCSSACTAPTVSGNNRSLKYFCNSFQCRWWRRNHTLSLRE